MSDLQTISELPVVEANFKGVVTFKNRPLTRSRDFGLPRFCFCKFRVEIVFSLLYATVIWLLI